MMIYKRHINKKLFSLRLTFFILVSICFFAFESHHDNLGYFIAVTIIMLSIIVVKDFNVSLNSFSVIKYYFFGLIKIKWQFYKGEIVKVSSFGSGFGQDGEIVVHDETSSELGCLFMIFSIFLPPKITKKEVKIEKFDEFNSLTKSVHILLDRPEFTYLETFIHNQQS